MSDVPIIAIDEAEDQSFDDDDSRRPSINDCHTDIEELDDNQDGKKKVTLNTSLKADVKCNGALTDVEDCEDSGEDEPEKEMYGGDEFSLNEFLDQGLIDEHSNLQGNVNKQKLQAMHSLAKTPSPTAFHLTINNPDLGGLTDVEDMEGSGDELEVESNYSEDDKPIILEGANIVDVHDSMNKQKKVEKYAPKVTIDRSSSSSDSEEDKSKLKLKPHHKPKRGQRCEDAKSDIENIYFSEDETRKKTPKSTPILDTPDIEVMAFEESDGEDNEKEQFPEINITFVDSDKNKNKKKFRPKDTPAPSPMLKLPENQDEALTDVENLNSSDDDDEDQKPLKPKNLMPIAVVKSDALTDVEDLTDDSNNEEQDNDDDSEVPLPSPVREFTVLVENKSGEPYKQTTPLPDNIYLGFEDLDADKGLTDVEDFDDSGDDEEEEPMKFKELENIPDLDGGYVESSDHAVVKDSTLRSAITPEPKTDTEDIFMKKQSGNECRRRKTKSKHNNKPAGKSLFLDTKFYVDEGAGSAHTDVEDLNLEDDDIILKDKNIKQRRATIECTSRKLSNGEVKTDVEYFSGDDHIDLREVQTPVNNALELIDVCTMTFETDNTDDVSKHLNIPEIRRTSATPRGSTISNTDVEQILIDTDNEEVSYSRAQTATPHEIHAQLNDLGASEVYDVHSRTFDLSQEYLEIKGNQGIAEAHTDIEFLD